MATVKELEQQITEQAAQIEALTQQLSGLMETIGVPVGPERIAPEDRADFIKHGSPEHAVFIGLVPAEEDDPLGHEGWQLVDRTIFGPNARPEYLAEVLRQKVSSLTSPIPVIQSDDWRKPNYAPPMIVPRELLMTA